MIELWLPRTTTAICLLSASRLEPTDCLFGQSSYFQCTVSDLIGRGGGTFSKLSISSDQQPKLRLHQSTSSLWKSSNHVCTQNVFGQCAPYVSRETGAMEIQLKASLIQNLYKSSVFLNNKWITDYR